MNRERKDVIELGAVSTETKGAIEGGPDTEGALQPRSGLSDD